MGKRVVKQQRTKVIAPSEANDESAYWQWNNSNGGKEEVAQANPDVLNDEDGNMLWRNPSKHTELETEVVSELKNMDLSKLLTPLEAETIKAYVVGMKSIAEICNALGVSKRRIYALLKSAGDKIRRELKIDG